jgi:plastocyanin
VRQHQPSTRIRYSLLRSLAASVVFAGQLFIQNASGGTITGTVHAEGKAGAETAAAGGNYSSHALSTAVRVDYAAMRDFVVFIDNANFTNATPATNVMQVSTLKVAQYHADFSPQFLPVLASTTIQWPNNDDIYHNVFSVSDAAQFDLGLYKDCPPDKQVKFDRPGKVDVYCSIHSNMHCIVLVMENPYFATTDRSGHFSITNVPPGKYKVKAWHERLPVDVQEITVPRAKCRPTSRSPSKTSRKFERCNPSKNFSRRTSASRCCCRWWR